MPLPRPLLPLLVLCSLQLHAQDTPDVNDSNLYIGALHLFAHLYQASESSTTSRQADELKKATMRRFGVSEADYAVLVAESAIYRVASPDSVGATLAHVPPRDGETEMTRLRARLSPAGWIAFSLFVNGDYRQHTTVFRVPGRASAVVTQRP